MDYDDDEFQGKNRQLAGEGRSKVSPVLHPYALPKFDFDDTLHEHLNFNSFVETEVFLGLEDNQWIEEYSRGSSGTEFNSSGVESRRNNVWLEVTSSESVEMLLSSVGQEEKVEGEAVTEQLDPDICDETVTLTKSMDCSLKQESQISGGVLDSVIINEPNKDNSLDDVILKEPDKDKGGSAENIGVSIEEFNAIGLSKTVSSDAAEESIQINKNSTDVPLDSDTLIVKSYISAETTIPFSENLPTQTTIPFSENPSTETCIPLSEKPPAENNIPFSENLPAQTSIPCSENPSTETSIPLSDKPLAEYNIPFSENLPAQTSIPFSENPSIETSIPLSEKPPADNNMPFSENLTAQTSIPFSEKPLTETSKPLSEKSPDDNNILFSESVSQMLTTKDPDSPKSNAEYLTEISPIKILSVEENETALEQDAQQIISDTSMVSASNLPERGCESSGVAQVDCNITSSEPGVIHLDQTDSLNENEDAQLALESNDMDIEVVQAVDSQKNVEPSLLQSDVSVLVEQVSGQSSSHYAATIDSYEQPKSPIFGVSLVHQGSKEDTDVICPSVGNSDIELSQVESAVSCVSENPSALVEKEASPDLAVKDVHEIDTHCMITVNSYNATQTEQEPGSKNESQDCFKKLDTSPSEGNSHIEFSQVESAVASVSKNPSALVEKEASPDLAVKDVREIDAHCVTTIKSYNASETELEPGSKNESQDCSKKLDMKSFDSPEKTVNISQTGGLQDPKESMTEDNNSNEHQTFADVALPSDITDNLDNQAPSVSLGNATTEETNLTSEVDKGGDLGKDDKGSLSSPTVQSSNLPEITDGPSQDSSSNQMDPKKSHEVSVTPPNLSVLTLTSQTSVKGKSESKPRRKSARKENTKKGTPPPARDSVRGVISPVLLSPSATGQVTRFEEAKSYENVTKPGVVVSSPKIPDLNNSTSIFQQPFTDNQQVQLRAQILVYGSLISGSPPEETHMIAAFGQSDGGKTWDGVWRACLERLHFQKSQPKSSLPIQSRSDTRDAGRSDQLNKHTPIQNKVPSSPIGGPNNLGTPPIVSPMIPFSSPLWNATTPSDNLQSSGITKTTHFDYHQTLPLRPTYQTPPPHILNYNSWLTQGPFSGQWLASSPIPIFNPAPRFPSLPITESVKLTPVKDSGGPLVLNSAPVIFPEGSSLSGLERSAVSSDQPPIESKSRKKKKEIPVVSVCSTSVAVSMPPAKFPFAVPSATHFSKGGNQNLGKVAILEENLTKVEESKLQAKEAADHADNTMFHCNGVWSQMQRRYKDKYDFNSIDEAKLVSSAVSIAAAASVAKAAATAAKIASDVAEQARSMVSDLNKSQNLDQSKHAENLDAIVKAAELAAEAVSQAGKIVAMSEPFSLKDLVEAGPEGYWKTPRLASNQQSSIAKNLNVESAPNKGILAANSGGDLMENTTMEVDGSSVPFKSHVKDKRKPRARKGPEVFKTFGTVTESEIRSVDTSSVGQIEPKITEEYLNECDDIKEGSLVEVFKDDDKHNSAWFGANVLSLKDGKALVSYTEIQSDEGSGKFNEWVPLKVEGSESPRIRLAHPVTTIQGTRKRRRTASTDFLWSSGDRVDVWRQNHWREGVVLENKIESNILTVQFPGKGEPSVVKSGYVRPSLIWKDGKWIMCPASEKHLSSPGNLPQEKRLKLGSPIVESKMKAGPSVTIDLLDPRKQEESRPLSLSTHERLFNVGTTRDNKVSSQRTMRSGSQKEGPGVVFGVPKPGKKQKFMDVSKHYVTGGSNIASHDSIKFTKYLIPNPPGTRGWKNNSRSDPKEKQAAETKQQMVKSRKPPVPSVRTLSTKSTLYKSSVDSVSDGENKTGQQTQMSHGSSSSIETKSERLNKRKFTPATGVNVAKVEKSIPEPVEPRRSVRKIQPTSRLLEGLQSSMTISKMPALSHSTQRSHKVTPKGTIAEEKEASNKDH